MQNLQFIMADVFAESKYSGNQLAVFLDAGMLSETEMQKIAREINFSETSFIISRNIENGTYTYNVRIFTPEYEVPFAGHPSLGTAYAIKNYLSMDAGNIITLNVKAGQIPVTILEDENKEVIYWMKQLLPVFGKKLSHEVLADVLGISPDDMDTRFPVEEVTTGLDHIIVPLQSLNALKSIKVSKEKYFKLVAELTAQNILVFCPESHHHSGRFRISTRMFAECLGISEDPATGSGNGCLAGYLVKHKYFGGTKVDIVSEQGYEIGRPSLLYLKAEENGPSIEIYVGGKVVCLAKGEFMI